MGIKLDTPAATEVAHDGAIVNVQLHVPHILNPDTLGIDIERAEIRLSSRIVTYNELGMEMDKGFMQLELSDLPNQVKSFLKDLYAWLETQAQARGLIGEGAPEPLDQT